MAGAPAARMALPSRRLPALRGSPAGSPASPSSCATPPGRSLPPPPPTPRLGHTAPQVRRRGRLGPQSGAAPGGGPGGSSRGPRGAEGSAGAVRRGKGGAEPSRAQLRGARGAEPQRERSAAERGSEAVCWEEACWAPSRAPQLRVGLAERGFGKGFVKSTSQAWCYVLVSSLHPHYSRFYLETPRAWDTSSLCPA